MIFLQRVSVHSFTIPSFLSTSEACMLREVRLYMKKSSIRYSKHVQRVTLPSDDSVARFMTTTGMSRLQTRRLENEAKDTQSS